MSQESKPIDNPTHQSNEVLATELAQAHVEEVKATDKVEEIKKDPTIQELMAR